MRFVEDKDALWSWMEDHDSWIYSYLEKHFSHRSYEAQLELFERNPYFCKKIIEDYRKSNMAKQQEYLNSLSYSDGGGKIVLVDGSRGGGKTGFGFWSIDEYHKRKPWVRYFYVSKSQNKPKMPSWIVMVKDVDALPNDCVALIDEGAIQLSSRRAMSKENKDASDQLVILRHRGITLIILVQNIKMVDTNVRRLADIRALKFGIPFGAEGEQANDNIKLIRMRLQPKSEGEVYVEILAHKKFRKFSHSLPPWWDDEKTSKSFKNWKPQKEERTITKREEMKEQASSITGVS